ncbi:MAG TPA: oxygenase MpaB family protein, partial [Myxococcaceae bacterium]|nr:oxygenase MpaB family protein [Myxococcaceae bacterium]
EMRGQGDPLADGLVQGLLGRMGGSPSALLGQLTLLARGGPATSIPELEEYLAQGARLPPWANLEQVRLGGELFHRYAPQVVLSLLCASLPLCYGAARGVRVLHHTGRLRTQPLRRLEETSRVLLAALSPGGLEPGGAGLRALQGVRLVHAGVRLVLLRGGWPPEWGPPLNQEELAATLTTFSVVIAESLARLGCSLTAAQGMAWLHTWNVVGALLGVEERLLPEEPAQARALAEAVARRHLRVSSEGQALLGALLGVLGQVLPGGGLRGVWPSLMRYLLGRELADILAVPAADWTRLLLGPLRMLGWLQAQAANHLPATSRLLAKLGRALLEHLLQQLRTPPERAAAGVPAPRARGARA